jgi:hypothetical protein
MQAGARQLAYSLARTIAASLLLERAAQGGDALELETARRWCRRGLVSSAGAAFRAPEAEPGAGLSLAMTSFRVDYGLEVRPQGTDEH